MRSIAKRLSIAFAVLGGLFVAGGPGIGFAQAPPAVTTRYSCMYEVASLPAEFSVVRWALETAPGTFSPVHQHQGNTYIAVVQGELTLRTQAAGGEWTEHKYPTGSCVTEPANVWHSGGNTGQAPWRLLITFLVPKGAQVQVFQDPGAQRPPGQTLLAMASFEGMPMSGPLDLVQSMSEYQPGASQPTHIHPGPGYATVIEGQITRRVYGPNPSTTVYNRGDSYHETPNEPHSAHNTAAGSTILSTTFLLPKGAQRIIFQPAPAPAQLPRTGDSGTAPLVLFGLGGVLLATGLALARFRRPA